MAYTILASMDMLTCTDYVASAKCQKQIWKNWLQPLGYKTQSFQEGWQQTISTSTKSNYGRVSAQPIDAIGESAGNCNRNFWRRSKVVAHTDTNSVQSYGWTTQTGWQGCWRGSSKRKNMCNFAALHCEQSKVFICSTPNICQKERGRGCVTICLREI